MPGRKRRAVERIAYTPAELADATGLGRSTVYELVRSGDLRAVRIGDKSIVITRASWDEYCRLHPKPASGSDEQAISG